MKPYYDHGGIRIYHGDCREISVGIDAAAVDLVVTDPPYGVSERTDRLSKGRSVLAWSHDFPPVYGDDKPFDPSHLMRFGKVVLFGANYYADKLPSSPSWIVWDKRDGMASNDNADCELAWSNVGGPARVFRHLWSGMLKASERAENRVHPTQKPVALMAWIVNEHSEPGQTILDPYMGSGPTLRAAKDLGRKAIGIEIEERYCEIAANRLRQSVMQFGASK